MELKLLPQKLAVVHLSPKSPIPEWAYNGAFFSITKTEDELSIFCDEAVVPASQKAVHGWRSFRVVGQIDLELSGILAALAIPLASKQISIFSISTYDTDYMVFQESSLADAVAALTRAGHVFV